MTELICEECGHVFFERSELAEMSPCPECGEDAVRPHLEEPQTPEVAVSQVDPRTEARAAAAALLKEQGISKPPVDVVAIAEALGYTVAYISLGNVSGELRCKRICVNKDHHRVRQRFSIAHELGHVCMHAGRNPGDSLIERQAEAFAGALLLPPKMLRAAVAEGLDLDALRVHFEVSRDALAIALSESRLTARVQKS